MNNKKQGGFTLIELLVVIAIIGILAALVLVALGNARDKANDAKIKSDIGQLRTIAEIIYDTAGSSYQGTTVILASCFESGTAANCGGAETLASVNTLKADIAVANTNHNFQANSDSDQFCVSARMKNNNYVCVDATGVFKDSTTTADCSATATVVACP